MSVDAWKSLCDVGTVVALFLAFAFGVGVWFTGNIINEKQAEQLRQFDKSLTEAKTELAKQQQRSAELEANNFDMRRVVELHRHVTNAGAEDLRTELRRIGVKDLTLNGRSTPDSEPTTLINEIWTHLHDAGWKETGQLYPYAGFASLIKPGIEVWTGDPEFLKVPGLEPATKTLIMRSWKAGEEICKWLRLQGLHSVEHKTDPFEPGAMERTTSVGLQGMASDGVLILVGERNVDAELKFLKEARIGKAVQQ